MGIFHIIKEKKYKKFVQILTLTLTVENFTEMCTVYSADFNSREITKKIPFFTKLLFFKSNQFRWFYFEKKFKKILFY